MSIEHYNFGNGWYILDWDKQDNVAQFLFGEEPTREVGTVYEEYACILDSHKNIVLPMSGGIDSETAAEVCVREGIPFDPLIMKMTINNEVMNQHDIHYAELFLRKHGITPQYIELDIVNFLKGGMGKNYAVNYYCRSPQLATHLWMMEKITGTPVFVGDFLSISNLRPGINAWKYFCYDFYLAKQNKSGVAKILSETPEIAAASFKLTIDVNLKRNNYSNSYERKCDLYKQAGFHVEPREKKYTGFENILKYYQDKYNGSHLYEKFNDHYRTPMELHSPQPDEIHVWFCEYFEDLIRHYKKR
jgi:hypothetical protein